MNDNYERAKKQSEAWKFFQLDEDHEKGRCRICGRSYDCEGYIVDELEIHMKNNHEEEWNKVQDKKKGLGVWKFFNNDDEEDTVECNLCGRSFEYEIGKDHELEIHMQNKHEEEWKEAQEDKEETMNPALNKIQETLEKLVDEVSVLRKEQTRISRKIRAKSSSNSTDSEDEPPKAKLSKGEAGGSSHSGEDSSPKESTGFSSSAFLTRPISAEEKKYREDCEYYKTCLGISLYRFVRSIKEILPNHGDDTAVYSFTKALKEISETLRVTDRNFLDDSSLFRIVADHAATSDSKDVQRNTLEFLCNMSESGSSVTDNFLLAGVLPRLRTAFMRHWTMGASSTVELKLILQICRNIARAFNGRLDDIIFMMGAASKQLENVSFDLKYMLISTFCIILDVDLMGEKLGKKYQPWVDLIEKEVKTWKYNDITQGFEDKNLETFIKICANSNVSTFCYTAAWILYSFLHRFSAKYGKFVKDHKDSLNKCLENPHLPPEAKELIEKVVNV